MIRKTIILLFLLGFAVSVVSAFEPVVVLGADVEHTASTTDGATSNLTSVRPRAAIGWRDRLDAGGYFSLDGLVSLSIPVDGRSGVSDTEMLDLAVSIPRGDDELLLGTGLQSSFVTAGAARLLVIPEWSADYRFGNDAGWIAVQSDGSYRFNDATTDDRFVQRAGVGYSRSTTIRLALETNALAGYELWPEYEMVDDTGSPRGETRHDLTAQLDATADGLVGYFTTWTVSGATLARFSNATRLLDTGAFEADPESRVTGRLSGSVRTSPTRQLGLGGRLTVEHDAYLSRPARDASGASLGTKLGVTSLDARVELDYAPVSHVYLVGAVGAGGTRSADPSYDRWYVQGRLGIEYSF
jgi:hypothetical protein